MDALRRVLVTILVTVFSAAFILVGGTQSALAKADCHQTDPYADVSVSQTISAITLANGNPGLLKQVTLVNGGPCNVPDVELVDTLPAGTAVQGTVTSNPNSWTCDTSVAGEITCVPGSTMGVPGTATVSIALNMPSSTDWVDLAQVYVGGGAATGDFLAGCATNTPATTCDNNAANNTSWGKLLAGSGDSFLVCNGGNNTSNLCAQSIQLSVGPKGNGGSTQIQNLTNGPNQCAGITGFTNCFGTLVFVTSSITDATKTLTVDASFAHGSFGGVGVLTSIDGTTWTKVSACNKTLSNVPCLVSKSKFKVGTTTFYQFQVYTGGIDDGWGFDG